MSLPLRREHGLGVKLDALGRQLAVPHAHHDALVRGAQLELVGQLGIRDERVIAARAKRALEPAQDAPPVVLDLGVLAVDRLAADRPAAERLDQRLVAEADPQRRAPPASANARAASIEIPASRRACRGPAR